MALDLKPHPGRPPGALPRLVGIDELVVKVEDDAWPPSLTPGAAAALLRILLKAADRRAREATGARDEGAWPLAS